MASELNEPAEPYSDAVAIIGMSCRFPDAPTPDAFWRNLRDGVESVRSFTAQDLLAAGVDPAIMGHPSYVNTGVVLEGADQFDAAFFGFNPRDAEILDPQQRIFLECAWEALEDAGYPPSAYAGPIGVYAGADMSAYLFIVYANPEIVGSVGAFAISLANDKDHVTTRVAYKLNLKGPAVTVQTTCSTSLVAVCQASQSLLCYQCDMALAGGTAIALPQRVGYIYQEGGIASPDGHCRAFDSQARGTIGGSGAGVVVLQRYADAVADGSQIRAVIRGFGVNNDGSLKVGYTAPSVDGQAEAIATAQAMAGVDPETITYIEAHGTGTPLGDPIEVSALTQVFRASTPKVGYCGIGSVKTNFGHLNSAAGVASLIKTVLALEYKQLPPSLHFKRPNPNLGLNGSPFYVVDSLRDWQSSGAPRRAGVSSFGIGGTNAHVVLEEASPPLPPAPSRPWQLLLLSARSSRALERATANLAHWLRQRPGLALPDVAYTLQVGRKAFPHRRLLLVDSDQRETTLDALEAGATQGHDAPADGQRPVVFMFSGQGAQYLNMGRELYEGEPAFREQIDRCAELLRPHLELDLRELVFGEATGGAAERLGQTSVAQPALFALEYALAQLWMAWGIQPRALVGHSIGEYVAACLAGVFALEDALALVAARGRLIQRLPPGAMLSVHLLERELAPLLDLGLSLAAVNAPGLCVVAGPLNRVERAQALLEQRGVNHTRLHTSHAFHSTLVEPVVSTFVELVSRISLQAPRLPYLSNLTGTWISAELATDPAYYGRHLRQTVQFARCLEVLAQDPKRILLEVGPGKTLGTLATAHPGAGDEQMVLSSLPHARERQPDGKVMLHALGQLWLAGAEVDWQGFYAHERRRRVSLPTYPFERQRYWVEPFRPAAAAAQEVSVGRVDTGDWFYTPAWQPAPLAPTASGLGAGQRLRWLVFSDDGPLAAQVPAELRERQQEVITVARSGAYERMSAQAFRLDPARRDDYLALFGELKVAGALPDRVLYLWSLAPGAAAQPPDADFFSLLFLAQAAAEHMPSRTAHLQVVSSGTYALADGESVRPEQALLAGACRVIGQELPGLPAQVIDVVASDLSVRPALFAELASTSSDPAVALRPLGRFTPAYLRVRLEAGHGRQRLSQGGVYLITGGLGGIGLALAGYLARAAKARLVLVGRAALPPREEWQARLTVESPDSSLAARLRKLLELQQLGAELLVASVDVCDRAQVAELAAQIRRRFGVLNGIIHAAGVAGGGIIQLKSVAEARRVMAPKLEGVQVLAEVFGDAVGLQFVLLCSSLSAQLGGVGQIDYCSANCYLDAFAHDNIFRRRGVVATAINWDTWAEVGMAVNTEVPEGLKRWQAEGLRRGIQTSEGMDAFERILGAAVPQVAVSTTDLPARIRQATRQLDSRAAPAPASAKAASYPRPGLSTSYIAPRNRVEATIAGIWEELMGIQSIGVEDNFLELGGHSLLAIQLISRIRDSLSHEVSVQAFFDAPTVASLAVLVGGEEPATSGQSQTSEPRQAGPPALTRLPRERYRGRVSPGGEVELPEPLRRPPPSPPSDQDQ